MVRDMLWKFLLSNCYLAGHDEMSLADYANYADLQDIMREKEKKICVICVICERIKIICERLKNNLREIVLKVGKSVLFVYYFFN